MLRGAPILVMLVATACANDPTNSAPTLPGFEPHASGEQVRTLAPFEDVRIVIVAPGGTNFVPARPTRLILYGVPNGNSIEHTLGKRVAPGDDWHFNIQHIAAQTRFLRRVLTNENVVVACLENDLKSWPAWRRKQGDTRIPHIVDAVLDLFPDRSPRLVLTGHSGGGSFTFGYLNTVTDIPDPVERIAFLDSNYAYETDRHRDKLVRWLKASDRRYLCVLAYHDSIALLDGKTFVSETGGTWGRSLQMHQDFISSFRFSETLSPEWRRYSALEGRLQLLLRENPEKKILHTVQVERNGFIHAMLTGTPHENRGYDYFGERAYNDLIQP